MDTDPNNEIRNWNPGITPDNDELDISSLIFPAGQLKVRDTTLLSLWALNPIVCNILKLPLPSIQEHW